MSISELTPDSNNLNRGSLRGSYILETSIRKLGIGRGVVTDKKKTIIGGNKTVEAIASIGLDNTIFVESDGNDLFAVRRTDLHLYGDDKRAQELGLADNRASQLNYVLDAEQLIHHLEAGIDMSSIFNNDELARIIASLEPEFIDFDPDDEDSNRTSIIFNKENDTEMLSINLQFNSSQYQQVLDKLREIDILPERAIKKLCKL